MAKIHTPAMEKIEKRNAKRKKPVKSTPTTESWKRFKRNPTALLGLFVVCILILVAIFAPLIAPFDYQKQDYASMMQAPSMKHLFGTDQFGRDIFSRVIFGTRYSLVIALFCTIAAFFSGGLLGIIAGYFGGIADTIIMRIMDVFQSIPMIMMAMCIVAVLGNGIPQLVAAVMFASMPTMARSNRAAILRVRGSDYIESSEAIGVGQIRMIIKHMIPNAVGVMIIYFVGFLAVSIMMMSAMSYIGVGLSAPTPEWGLILNDGKAYLTSAPYMMLFPAMMIMITCFAFNLMGDGLRDAFDPRLK
ncbi:ABC transporter permease [Anaerobium acetethylicum]|uniref:Peptide/nickel transport system permease protein n=1 Tax=Anaerobium acetethylicum TaxID=1619234 RepID=A0A1D3TQJ8_9FIRM|nr:ABC transporter permease [Anaerobium acetethylicum]SCP95827.1 peptide/nickel transport system permease protein [Anaerobium acetethylicum]